MVKSILVLEIATLYFCNPLRNNIRSAESKTEPTDQYDKLMKTSLMIQQCKKLLALCLIVLLTAPWNHLLAAPSSDLWPRWAEHDAGSTRTIDHSEWNTLLGRYVQVQQAGVNRFNYAEVTASDRSQLQSYIATLSAIPISEFNRNEQIAFWINLYNALTVEIILQHYPVDTIREISYSLFTSGPWREKLIKVEGEALALDDIEHRILRPIWKDPRIHYAVSCAAIGCPSLQSTAYRANNTDAVLDQAAREFINHPRAVSISYSELRVSSLYDWFEQDFGGNAAGVIAHLNQYADAKLQSSLRGRKRIGQYHFDWTINDPKSREYGAGRVGHRGS